MSMNENELMTKGDSLLAVVPGGYHHPDQVLQDEEIGLVVCLGCELMLGLQLPGALW